MKSVELCVIAASFTRLRVTGIGSVQTQQSFPTWSSKDVDAKQAQDGYDADIRRQVNPEQL